MPKFGEMPPEIDTSTIEGGETEKETPVIELQNYLKFLKEYSANISNDDIKEKHTEMINEIEDKLRKLTGDTSTEEDKESEKTKLVVELQEKQKFLENQNFPKGLDKEIRAKKRKIMDELKRLTGDSFGLSKEEQMNYYTQDRALMNDLIEDGDWSPEALKLFEIWLDHDENRLHDLTNERE